MRAAALLIVVLGGITSPAVAVERQTGAAATLLPLQALGQGARPMGMAGAFVSVKGDPLALHFNPAGQAFVQGSQLSLQHHAWVSGIYQESLTLTHPFAGMNAGLALECVDYGSSERTDEQGAVLGDFNARDYGLGLALARSLGPQVGAGMLVRAVQRDLGAAAQTAFSGDLGLLWSPQEMPVSLGLAYTGLGASLNGEKGTSALRAGLSYDWGRSQGPGLLLSLAGLGHNNSVGQAQAGLEARWSGLFFARAGYQIHFQEPQLGGTGLACGLGVRSAGLSLDYAYSPYGILGSSHRLGLGYRFSTAAAQASVPEPRAAAQPVATPVAPVRVKTLPAQALYLSPIADLASGAGPRFEVPAQEGASAAEWRRRGHEHYRRGEKAQMVEAFEKALALEADEELRAWLEKNRVVR